MNRRGLSVLELMLSMALLLLVSLYCISMFSTGQSHFVRAQQYSQCRYLVNAKMQDVLATPFAYLHPVSGHFDNPCEEFVYSVTIEPYETDMSRVSVEVVSRRGAVASAQTLMADDEDQIGVAADPATDRQVTSNGTGLVFRSEGTTLSTQTAPGSRLVRGVVGSPGWNLLWTASPEQGLMAYREADGWRPVVAPPSGAPSTPRFTGLAANAYLGILFAGDSLNRCVWVLDDAGTPSWRSAPAKPLDTPLGAPSGVACDRYGSLVWVADRENQCLRKLLVTSGTAPYADLEPAPGIGFWDKKRFRPPGTVGMGSPTGLAMDPLGYAVYVLDRGRLYRFVESENKWTVLSTFPTSLVEDGPAGLALDWFENVFYINTRNGHLWKFKPGGGPPTKI